MVAKKKGRGLMASGAARATQGGPGHPKKLFPEVQRRGEKKSPKPRQRKDHAPTHGGYPT